MKIFADCPNEGKGWPFRKKKNKLDSEEFKGAALSRAFWNGGIVKAINFDAG